MSKNHHPSEESLLRYAAGTLGVGPSIVVGAHVAGCRHCRARVMQYRSLGGAVLESLEPTPMSPTALTRALAALEEDPAPASPPRAEARTPIIVDGVRLPDTLAGCRIGKWRWMGPGMRISRVRAPSDETANIILIKVGPGRNLPEHGHVGTEFTYVVSGSFSDETGRYMPGDLAEMGAEVEHQPVVDSDGDCICLAALEGGMRFNSFLGRLIKPLYGV